MLIATFPSTACRGTIHRALAHRLAVGRSPKSIQALTQC
jgi:hypothetical protein